MFLGQSQTSLKSGRIKMPDSFNKNIQNGVYITQGFDQNLLMLTTQAFESLAQHLSALNMANPVVRMLQRLILGSAGFLEIDEQKDLTLPAALMQYAGLTNDAVMIGQGDYIEIWSAERWQKQQELIREALASNSLSFAELTIKTR
jgi:MraZ protein